MKHFFSVILLSVLTSLVITFSTYAQTANHPNVIIILADDLGWSDLGCYGSEIPTPNLDQLAAGGVRLTSFNTSARCCPSRASLITGLHPHQAGIGSFTTARPRTGASPAYTGHLLPTCVTLAEILGDAGYSTWMVGKWHMGIPGPMERGFQNYFGYKDFLAHSRDQWTPDEYVRLPESVKPELTYQRDKFYVTDVFSDYALEFLKQARTLNKPYFLYLAHSSPHFPVQAPKASIDQNINTYRQGWDILRAHRFERQKKLGLINADAQLPPLSMVPVDDEAIANGYSGQPNPAWNSLPQDRREDLARRMATFAAMVQHVDQGVGRILADLKEHNEMDNTLIFFLSDNGACYEWGPFGFDEDSRRGITKLHNGAELDQIGQPGTHQAYGSAWANLCNTPLNMYKHFCHEGGLASPLIVSWPQYIRNPNRLVTDPAHLMDIVPTVLEAIKLSYPKTHHGQDITPVAGTSLLAAINGQPLPTRSLPFDHQGAHGLHKGKWKIVWGKRQPTKPTWELYNLETDRSEQHNLASQHPELLAELVAEWEDWARNVGVEGYWQAPESANNSSSQSPQIANLPISIVIEVNASNPHGVVLAQGGREYGYALHFIDGKAAFDVRINGQVTRVMASQPANGAIRVMADLTKESMTLAVDGQPPVSKPSPGLIPVQPKDDLSIGLDTLSAAGDYQEPNPFNGTIISTRIEVDDKPPSVATAMNPAKIRAGLKSHDQALFIKPGWIRDPYIILGPDNWYYLTGTTPNPDEPREKSEPYNTGLGQESIVGWKVQLWRSRNLINWQSLGTPFTLKDGIWYEDKPERFQQVPETQWRLWAPEVHWLGDRWALVHTSPSPVNGANFSLTAGPELQGPWQHPMGTALGRRHDPSLFKDDDGAWYMLWQNTLIAPLSKDLTQFTAEPVRIDPAGSRIGPDGTPISRIGHEGATMRKIGRKYVHFGTAWSTDQGRKGSYNLYYCTADKITGPFGPRQFAGRFLGHGTPFQDKEGRWWCTAFYNGNVPPLPRTGIQTRDLSETAQTINQQGVTIVPLEVRILDSGNIYIRAKDPDYANPGPDERQKFE